MISIQVRAQDDFGGLYGSFNIFLKDFNALEIKIKKKLDELGNRTAQQMIQIIQDNKVRPQNGEPMSLEKNINCEHFSDGWGVGNIDELNEKVGYWAAVNWGSSHMVGKRVPSGYFSPGKPNPSPDAFRQGRWNVNELPSSGMRGGNTGFEGEGNAHWSFIVNKPIPPMNYIEKTAMWLDGELSTFNL